MNSYKTISHREYILLHQSSHSDSTKIPNVYDGSKFTPWIASCVPIFIFLCAKSFGLGL